MSWQEPNQPSRGGTAALAWIAVIGGFLLIQKCERAQRSTSSSSTSYSSSYESSGSKPISTESAPQPTLQLETPTVPALRSGETPPTDLPNYFDTRELGAASVGLYHACISTAAEVAPKEYDADGSKKRIDAYCSCLVDAARMNGECQGCCRTVSVSC